MYRTRGRVLRAILGSLCLVAGAAVHSAGFHGAVLDEAGAPIPGAMVTARFHTPFQERTVFSDDAGRYELTGLPVLLADACAPRRDPARYAPMLRALRELPYCVGWHYCGAYLKNRVRAEGFRNERDEPDEALIGPVRAANRETREWVERQFA